MLRKMNTQGCKGLFLLTVATIFSLAITPAQAEIISAGKAVQAQAQVTQTNDRHRIETFLAREDVKAELKSMGVRSDDAAARVAALSPEELAQLSTRIDQVPAGGDIVAIVGVTFIVLLILEALGITNVFTGF